MTAQKLYGTLKFLDVLDNKLGLQASLDSIRDSLNNLVNTPAQPQHQSALASALSAFTNAAARIGESITPSQAAVIGDMGGGEFFDPLIAEKVKASISANAMTPSVARDFVQDLSTRRATFLLTARTTLQGLEKLRISDAGLEPGAADLAFLIPRGLFKNHLGEFAKELKFISKLIRDFGEVTTGRVEPVELQELSSSVPTVTLAASAAVIVVIANVVNKFLEAWKKIEEIREIRCKLEKMSIVKKTALEELTEEITTTVDQVIEESIEAVLPNYKGDNGRKNELATALKQDTRRLFGQIERGLTIEFRAKPKGDGDDANEKALEDIANLSREIQFPQIANEPMLLGNGEILEGEIQSVKHSKKTTTHKTTKTTSSNKEARKDTEQ